MEKQLKSLKNLRVDKKRRKILFFYFNSVSAFVGESNNGNDKQVLSTQMTLLEYININYFR